MSEKYTYGVWRDEQANVGHQAEEYLETFFKSYAELGLIKEVKEEDYGKTLNQEAFFRTTPKTDFEEGWDFGYYDSNNRKWYKIDLTTIADRTERLKKEEKNRQAGIKTMFIPLHVIEKASLSKPAVENPNEFQREVIEQLRDTVRQ
jgi:hypothetical protein